MPNGYFKTSIIKPFATNRTIVYFNMNFSSKSRLSQQFEDYLNKLSIPKEPISLYDPVRYILALGGKRVRPQLVLLGCGLPGGNPEKAFPAAAAIELLHNFTLIHDDIMDGASSRRGKPTVHTRWDEATAILSGDVMFTLAFEELYYYSEINGFEGQVFPELHRIFSEASRIVCEGQARDLEFETMLEVSHEQYLNMISQKTAALLKSSLKMGGVIAGANPEELQALGELGESAGLAFQIQDDLLDAIADPDTFGKRKGGDIYEGKKTFLTILALERANPHDRSKILSIIQNSECTESDVDYVVNMFYKLNVISDTQKNINNLYIKGLQALETFNASIYKDAVIELLDKLKSRQI